MKLTPTFILLTILCLTSCQGRENTNREEPAHAATDTTITQTAAPQPVDSAYLIVPGEGIGKVKVGMKGQELSAVLGEPDSTDAAMGKALLYWVGQSQPLHYLAVYTKADFGSEKPVPTVKQLQVTSPQFQTAGKVSAGTPLPEVRQKYSNLKPIAYYQNDAQQRVYIFDDQQQGIAFEVTLPDSICTAITVHEKGKALTGDYLPVHPDMTLIQ